MQKIKHILLLLGCLVFMSCEKENQNNAFAYFEISPNPGSTVFQVSVVEDKWAVGTPIEFNVTDGKDSLILKIFSNIQRPTSISFELSNRPLGFYYANLSVNGQTYSQKFIKAIE
ncbi:MAG TPA: hypothetical protein PKD51_11995 [Saprospiraceae bacterium]|nr:hypothetical protein [Saprospiraceae bacterium]HMU03477.1 hypothetical protein [Saprospiraceae bacterium]